MKVVGIENMSGAELQSELDRGAKFVVYQYCVSILIMTFMRPSGIYFVRAGEHGKGWMFTLLSAVAGWWGIPWGPIRTIQAIVTNVQGGKDVTADVVRSLKQVSQQK